MGRNSFGSAPGTMAVLRDAVGGVECLRSVGIEEAWDIPIAQFRYQIQWEQILPASGEVVLSLFDKGARFERKDGLHGSKRGGDRPGTIALVDGLSDRSYVALRTSSVTQYYIRKSLFGALSEGSGAGHAPAPRLREQMFESDAGLVRLAREYAAASFDRLQRPTRLEMDARALLLGAAIFRRYGEEGARRRPPVYRFSSRQSSAIVGYILGHLQDEIRLGSLARLVGYSEGYFCQVFRATFGISPHQFVIARRLEKARSELAGRKTLAEIALDCGFSSQPHFTTAFRRAFGMPPASLRRQALTNS